MSQHYLSPQDRHQVEMFSSLDDRIIDDNPVRLMDLLVDLIVDANPDRFQKKGNSNVWRKAYSPQTLLKLYLYGYLNSISSSRKLERETGRNIELMWLLGNLQPDHKTISDYRKDNGDEIRLVTLEFRKFLKEQKYIRGKNMAIDGTRLRGNTRQSMLTFKKIRRRLKHAEEELLKYLDVLRNNDRLDQCADEYEDPDQVNLSLIEKIAELEEKIRVLQSIESKMKEEGKGTYSTTDPDATLIKSANGYVAGYNIQAMVDEEHKMIAYAEAESEPNDTRELAKAMPRLKEQLQITPEEVEADKGYFRRDDVHDLDQQSETQYYVGVPEPQGRKKEDKNAGISFEYDPDKDLFNCSEGKTLPLKQKNRQRSYGIVDVYQGKDCQGCRLQSLCTSSKYGRIINRRKEPDLWLVEYRKRMKSLEARKKLRKRKAIVEHPFGTLKIIMGKIPIKVRGKGKVQTEIDLYATIYNLKRLFNIESFDKIKAMILQYDWKVG